MHPTRRRRVLRCAVIAACAVVLCASTLFLNWREDYSLPRWIQWNDVELAADLNGDGHFEALQLENKQLKIYEDGTLSCTSPDGWFISDVLLGDLDSDGTQEIICLTWKRGSFGESKPFWIEHDSPDFSQHVFIFHYENGELRHHWLSSDIGMEVESASLDSLARLHLHTRDGQNCLLEWQDWGLTFVDEDNPSMREADYSAVSLIAVGDNIAHAGILEEAEDPTAGSYDFSPIYANVTDLISSYDMAAVNQETPLVYDPALYSGDFPLFGTPVSMGDALARSGFDIVEAATNHAGDKGVQGIHDTISFWHDNYPEVQLLGLNDSPEDCDTITYREAGGIRFALFDYAFGLNSSSPLSDEDAWHIDTFADIARLKAQLGAEQSEADVSICFLHCGEEYASSPSADEESLVEGLIDAGADVIICTHPHVVQRTQTVTTAQGRSGLVCYSLGNFAANQTDPATVLESAVSLVFEKPTHANEDGTSTIRIASCTMIPMVCHFSDGKTSVCLLKDYTAQLAREHYLNSVQSGSVTLEGLHDQWIALTR